jgi:hypothetical protein
MPAKTEPTTSASLAHRRDDDIDDLKTIVAQLAALIERQSLVSTPLPAAPPPDEPTDAPRKYGLLSALMVADKVPAELTFTVARDGTGAATGDGATTGLKVNRGPDGPTEGTWLAGAGQTSTGERQPFSLLLGTTGASQDTITATQLTDAKVDVNAPFEQFELRVGNGGPFVAVAPELPAVAKVSLSRDKDLLGLTLQRPGRFPVQGGTHLTGKQGAKQFTIPLCCDRIPEAELDCRGLDITQRFDNLQLRVGADGPVVAVAPDLGTTTR